jgi:hypothetical protein
MSFLGKFGGLLLALLIILFVFAILVVLLLVGFFNSPTLPSAISKINEGQPWTPFSAIGTCLTYPTNSLDHVIVDNITGSVFSGNCLPPYTVSGVRVSRSCLLPGCTRVDGTTASVGDVEETVADCSTPYKCVSQTQKCFTTKGSCAAQNIETGWVSKSGNCLNDTPGSTGLAGTPGSAGCVSRLINQQWNFVPGSETKSTFGVPLQIVNPNTNFCLNYDSVNNGVVEGRCSGSNWLLTPGSDVTYVNGVSPSSQVATQVSLVWGANLSAIPEKYPTTSAELSTIELPTLNIGSNGSLTVTPFFNRVTSGSNVVTVLETLCNRSTTPQYVPVTINFNGSNVTVSYLLPPCNDTLLTAYGLQPK